MVSTVCLYCAIFLISSTISSSGVIFLLIVMRKDYSPGYFNINDEVLAHVKEVIWTKYGFMSEGWRIYSGFSCF
jgi:hypothetical protein